MKILEIGSYPPPNNGWSVRIKFLKEGFIRAGHDCRVLNMGRNRKIKSPDYIDVQGGIDYLKKLIRWRLMGYRFHVHTNAQAVKGPVLVLAAQLVSLLIGRERPALTFHGGIEQLFFPRRNAGKMRPVVYLNFLLSGLIICNNADIRKEITDYGPRIPLQKIYPIPAFSVQYLDYTPVALPDEIREYISGRSHVVLCYIVLRNGFFLSTVISFLKKIDPPVGIILSGVRAPEDPEVVADFQEIHRLAMTKKVLIVEDLDHDTFMTLLKRSTLYLRTPVSDGVSSSVLEALAQGVPVVASENGRRPEYVITYKADDADDLHAKVAHALEQNAGIRKAMRPPAIRDTVCDEAYVRRRYFEQVRSTSRHTASPAADYRHL